MNNIEAIEREVAALDKKALAQFRDWFLAFDHAQWDRQIEADSNNGRFDRMIDEALEDHRTGNSTPL